MKEYETFDKYLSDSRQIQAFIDDRLNLMFEVFKISTLDESAKTHWIEKIGCEFEAVLDVVEKFEARRNTLGLNSN